DLIVREQGTLWNSVPAMMEMLVDYAESQSVALPDSLRLAIMGGDWLPVSLPNRLKTLVPQIQILSVGGPTETTLWNIGYLIEKVDPNWKSIPYGQPMANSNYYILNEALEDCPVWVRGQMYCAGVQLAKGYWRDKEKTNANFITHPRTGERLYRTGDLGRYLPDGNIEFLGREDFQIKIRGHRIEAGEIEAALMEHSAVRSAIITAVGKEHSKEQLIAYIVPKEKFAISIEEISEFLKKKLPAYMMPSAFVFLETLPLSTNGKVDRRLLPTEESLLQKVETAYIAPQTDIETILASVWQEVLELEKVGVNDNFFDLGGNSLLITKTYQKIKDKLPNNQLNSFSLVDFFNSPTIRSLAHHLSKANPTNSFNQEFTELEQNLSRRKHLLKQRFERSREVSP
ncbi:MAG TPA: non-ribosomal peptide synthetase, partial [Cyanobacteria bacterium UBA12227]|nr:non-ribosomal peptide synthetase [Cyanobacteria bacterium UBA12227]